MGGFWEFSAHPVSRVRQRPGHVEQPKTFTAFTEIQASRVRECPGSGADG
jgi:hypothetical protein